MLFRNSREAMLFWQKISDGRLDSNTIERLKEVAFEIVQATFADEYEHAARRADATLRAVGWGGRMEKYPGLKHLATEELPDAAPTDIAKVADLLLADFPTDADAKTIAKTVRAYRSRK
ncbi:hypothetical protein GPA27_19415 [Aromatoleum toluolicum]|uniref:Uncharacterized protein n=1 Tax=Aromatoleum toluolicum TaxID=90060 RepID=A0ABX1NK70_9RHOO|nr:hypothetical protein [Aromatoleum toluolicum]NMF99550.1 hypothetical protein [Aromatoleum toluolicum]